MSEARFLGSGNLIAEPLQIVADVGFGRPQLPNARLRPDPFAIDRNIQVVMGDDRAIELMSSNNAADLRLLHARQFREIIPISSTACFDHGNCGRLNIIEADAKVAFLISFPPFAIATTMRAVSPPR